MSREAHVRFWESAEVRSPRATHLVSLVCVKAIVSLRQACVVAVWRAAWGTKARCDQWSGDVPAGSSIWR